MQGWARRDGSHRRARGLAAAENRGGLEGLPRRSSRCASAQPHRWGSADEVPRPGLPARATPRLSRRSSSGKRYVGVVPGARLAQRTQRGRDSLPALWWGVNTRLRACLSPPFAVRVGASNETCLSFGLPSVAEIVSRARSPPHGRSGLPDRRTSGRRHCSQGTTPRLVTSPAHRGSERLNGVRAVLTLWVCHDERRRAATDVRRREPRAASVRELVACARCGTPFIRRRSTHATLASVPRQARRARATPTRHKTRLAPLERQGPRPKEPTWT